VKNLFFNRKRLLRAIHIAAVLLGVLSPRLAKAQVFTYGSGSATAPYSNNLTTASIYSNSGSIVLTESTSSGAYYAGLSILPTTDNTTTNSGPIQVTVATVNASANPVGIDFASTTNGSFTFQNNGAAVSATATDAQYSGTQAVGLSATTGTGSITITNQGSGAAISAMGTASHYQIGAAAGVQALTTSGAISVSNLNGATLSGTGIGTDSGYNGGDGTGIGVNATTTSGLITITNSSDSTISGSGSESAYGALSRDPVGYGINVTGSDVTITNNGGTIIGTSTTTAPYMQAISAGINVSSTGVVTISNSSGTIEATNTMANLDAADTGINVSSSSALTITNSAAISGIGVGYGNVDGINGVSSGTLSIENQASATVSATGALSVNVGISASDTGGNLQIINAGTITATGDGATGISASNSSPTISSLQVTNTGIITATGTNLTSYGISLSSPGMVQNSGSITAAVAIDVASGSSVTLSGNGAISGTIKGGSNSFSNSTLTFNLAIPAAQLAATRAQLATEVVAYSAQSGGAYTFILDGTSFDVLNFLYGNGGIISDLVAAQAARLYADTPGYQSLGSVLDNLPTDASSTRILTALDNLPDSGVAAALAELSPKELQIFRNVAFDNNTFNAANVNNHLANLRDGLTGFDDSQMTVRDGSMDPSLNQVRSHLLAFNPAPNSGLISDSADSLFGGIDMKDTRVNTMPTDRWSSFISGDVILADTSHNTNLDDADYTTGNVTGGLDYRLDQHFTVGALFAYAHTDANLDSRGSSATVDSYSPGIYASYVEGGWYGNALGAYTRNAYTEDRQIDITGLTGDNHGATSGNQGSVNLTGGYEFQKGSFKFGPVASVQYVHLAIDSMQEDGPTALSIASQDQDSFRSLLGFEGRFSTKVATCYGPMILTPHVSASWQHEYLDNSQGINANFTGTGGGSFTTETDTPDRDSAFVDVGLDATVAKNVTLFVDYEAQAGQENFFAQSARGGVKIGF
jgi:fibronectin-binding autotransporter adhesin